MFSKLSYFPPCCAVKPLVTSNRLPITFPEKCISNLSVFFFFKTKSHSYLFSLFIYDLVLWFTMKIKVIWYVASTLFIYTKEVVFAYLFLLPFVLTSLSPFSTSLIVLSLSSSLGSLPLLIYHINVYQDSILGSHSLYMCSFRKFSIMSWNFWDINILILCLCFPLDLIFPSKPYFISSLTSSTIFPQLLSVKN